MLTNEDLKNHLVSLLKDIKPGDISAIYQKLTEHMKYSIDNYDILAPEAQEKTDKILEKINAETSNMINLLPEGKEKRKLQRTHAVSLGRHFDILQNINELENPPKEIDNNLEECIKIFVNTLQKIADFIYDITQHSFRGATHFAQLSLLMLNVNELLVTLHLLKHRYVNQAYTHIRTVFENLDKVALFRVKPQWADVWIEDNSKKVRKELSPKEVRKKLGKGEHDPIYNFFSALGPHGTFRAVQVQSARKKQESEEKTLNLKFWVGGSPFEHNMVWLNGFAIYALYSEMLQLMRSFEKYLNIEECEETLKTIFLDLKNYITNYFLVWAKKENLDIGDFEEFLESKSWDNLQ